MIHQITTASISADYSAVLERLKEKPRYKEAEQKKIYHRDSALMHDTKSQDAYCKAGKSCMPGGNVFRKIEGRYHKARFQSHTDKALREAKKLTEMKILLLISMIF